jgi:SAM-dependent methyltransferase
MLQNAPDPAPVTNRLDIAKVWEVCLEFEYDRNLLVRALVDWLSIHPDPSILDAACGTGFPALDLIGHGFRVTCADGSAAMLRGFHRNSAKAGLAVQPHHVRWENLSTHFTDRFDIAMCRGNSLIYAGTWDQAAAPDRQILNETIRNLRACLKPGGTLYVDTTCDENLNRDEPEVNHYPVRRINGSTISLSETIDTDRDNRSRTWILDLNVDGIVHRLERRSHYLPHSELVALLRDAGFENIRRHQIAGEHYDVFLATAV